MRKMDLETKGQIGSGYAPAVLMVKKCSNSKFSVRKGTSFDNSRIEKKVEICLEFCVPSECPTQTVDWAGRETGSKHASN